jgi:hypothetical protein
MQPEILPVAAGAEDLASASSLFDKGLALLQNRNVRPALSCFSSAQQLGYDAKECAAARWDCWMLLGNFERAWQESDFISAAGGGDPNQFWTGQPWAGKRVMLRCLHGLGDTIQFVRYAPLLRETCRSVFVQTHPQLVNLIRGVPGVDHVFTWGDGCSEDPSGWDVQMEVTELPRAFRTTIPTIPAVTPYIQVPEERIRWASNWFEKPGRLRIGVAWEAGPWDCLRSISLAELSPLFAHKSCQFYGLQKGVDPASLPKCGAVRNLECYATDIRDTAALVLNLDLVITVDTMTAHLAGALGCPVWILLPARADWRWMLDRCDTPWYPTARLFRQRSPGGWTQTVEDVRTALVEFPTKENCKAQICRDHDAIRVSGPAGSARLTNGVNL